MSFEAKYFGQGSGDTLPLRIDDCLYSTTASVSHRLSAATMLMIQADNDGDEGAAHRVYSALMEVEPRTRLQRIDSITAQVVYHAAFGAIEQTPALLRELVSEARVLRNPALRAHHIRRSCFGLARYVDESEAAELLQLALGTLTELGLSTQAALCIEELAIIAIWRDDEATARTWIDQLRTSQSDRRDPICQAVEHELQVLLAFAKNDPSALPDIPMPGELGLSYVRSARGRQSLIALTAMERVLRNDAEGLHASVASLLQLHETMKARGYQDQIVAALITALDYLGNSSEAVTLLCEYLACRRELKPPLRVLKSAANRLAVHA